MIRTLLIRTLPLFLALAVVPACDNDEDEAKKKDKSAETDKKKDKKAGKKKKPEKKKSAKASALAPIKPATKLGDFPIAEDLEEEADRTVAIENLEAELDRLEAEIVGAPD